MRINQEQIQAIIYGIEHFRENAPMTLRLHGSRVNPVAKGGDIDLLLVVHDQKTKDALNLVKHKILVEIKELIGDQKIDLLITSDPESKQDPFIQMLLSKSVILKEWH